MAACSDGTKLLITHTVDSLNAVYKTTEALRGEMCRLASLLQEFDVMMDIKGTGPITGSQIMAEDRRC